MISRRAFFVALAGAPLAACNTTQLAGLPTDGEYAGWYIGTREDHPFPIPLVDRSRMRPEQRPQSVAYHGPERPGTVVVDIDQRFLYLVQGDGTAMRYAVGVGRQGFSWKGVAYVGRKAAWPDWRPTSTMVKLKPNLQRYAEGGLGNPLGARARSISTRATATSCSASTARTSPGPSASRSRRAASACSAKTLSTSTTAFRSARPCS